MVILTDMVKSVRSQFARITTGSTNRRIFGAALLVGSLTFVVKLGAMVKESFVAAYYGTGTEYDAFVIALLIPNAAVGIVAGPARAALMPTFIEVREQKGEAAAQQLYASILMWNMFLLLGTTLLLAITVSFWLPGITSGFNPQKLELTRSLFFWSLPIIVIGGFSNTWSAILNAGEKFRVTSLAPGVYSIAIIASLLLVFRSMGIFALLMGTVLGTAMEAVIVGTNLQRRGYPLMPRWYGITSAVRKVRNQYAACIADSLIMSGITLVDQAMASMLGPRSNSALSYGNKMTLLVLSLGATALATAILPQFSRLTATNDWQGLRRCLRTYIRLIMGITIPVTLILILFSSSFVRLLYQRGAFAESDTQLVATVQSLFLLQVPFTITLVLVTRAIVALKANQILMIVAGATFILNALLNYVFMIKFGVAGIALSTSCCILFIFVALTSILYRYLLPKAELSDKESMI